jgi:hypothetical protein
MPSKIDTERVRGYLNELSNKIQTQADPDLLNQYRSLIRKHVSFFRRSYLTAYLLMEWERQAGSAGRGLYGNRPRRNPSAGSPPEAAPRYETKTSLPPEESTRLFVSAGRNSRAYPREFLSLITSNTTVSKEDVGTIRILAGYSFIEVRSSRAGEIIAALDGISFRGRPLTVNYARDQKEGRALKEAPPPDEVKFTAEEPQTGPESSSAEQIDDHGQEEGV